MYISNRKKLMIVEPSVETHSLLGAYLRREGYEIAHVNDSQQALQLLHDSDEFPGVILLDLMMPEMDGYEFRRRQEMDPRIGEIPILVITHDDSTQINAIKIGAQGFLKKPFDDLEVVTRKLRKFFV